MDSTPHIDCGVDPTLPFGGDEPATATETVRQWALALNLRPGNTSSFRPSALARVVAKWAAEKGWTPPPVVSVGRGLAAAGLRVRVAKHERRLMLTAEDVTRLRKLLWEAWAPRVPPGERARNRPGKLPLACALAKLAHLEPPAPDFHTQLALEKLRCKACCPIVDSTGRCYPSVPVAARVLAIKADRGRALTRLRCALRHGQHWHGRLWRKLLPHELALIPQGALCGVQLEVLNWKSLCVERAQHAQSLTERAHERYGFGAAARDDDREG